MGVREPDQEKAVAEVREPERDGRGDERQPETIHRPVEGAVELQAERVPAVEQKRRVHDERSGDVSDQHAEWSLVEHYDEEDRGRDRDRDIRERCGDVCSRALLDAEERGHLLVVQRGPKADERCDDETAVAVRSEEEPRDLRGEHDSERRGDRGRGHDVPERGAHDEVPSGGLGRVEVEAEERALHPLRDEGRQYCRQRNECLDQPVVARREVARVQR